MHAVVLQLAIIVICGWLATAAARRWGQSAAVGQMVMGLLLGPSLLGWIASALVSSGATATPPHGVLLIFAGFAAGVALHRWRRLVELWDARAAPLVNLLVLPLYFTYTGLRTHVGSLDGIEAWAWCMAVIAIAMLGKYGMTYLAARSAGLAHAPSSALGAMMNTRGLVELVVLNAGYDLGVISRQMFTMMVLMAIVSTVITTPILRRSLEGAGHLRGRPLLN